MNNNIIIILIIFFYAGKGLKDDAFHKAAIEIYVAR
jgi:hypothetical protein